MPGLNSYLLRRKTAPSGLLQLNYAEKYLISSKTTKNLDWLNAYLPPLFLFNISCKEVRSLNCSLANEIHYLLSFQIRISISGLFSSTFARVCETACLG